jgi:glutathione synthase/RimK-type ligase-like ATP-grasp enzyme
VTVVIVIADQSDLHADSVIDKLDARTQQVVRIDPFREDLNYTIDYGAPYFIYEDKKLHFQDITGIYCRLAIEDLQIESTDPIDRFSFSEHSAALIGILLSVDRERWINYPWTEAVADHKVYSLSMAKAYGLSVPPTVTGTPKYIKKYLIKHRSASLVLKQISDFPIGMQKDIYCSELEHGSFSAPYTTTLDRTTVERTKNNTPIQAQLQIKVQNNIRTLNIDGQLFSTIMEHEGNFLDSRLQVRDREAPFDIGDEVSSKLRCLQRNMGLRLAAYDFLEDANGNWYLVDVNPAGSWLWQDFYFDQSISRAIADSLSYTVNRNNP